MRYVYFELQPAAAMAQRRLVDYRVHRDVLDEDAVSELAEKSDSKTSLRKKVKESVRCSGPRLKSILLGLFPVISWLPRYAVRENALGDLVSGISVGIMQLPQGMAYALLAAVPPVFGLYSSFYPVLVYFIFGTSRHISVGTYAVMSVMIGGVTERLAPDSNFMIWDNVTNASVVDTALRDAERIRVAAAVTLVSGIFQIVLGVVQFGFVVTYLSDPLVRGYTTGAAIHVIVSQLKYTFGINPERHSGPLSLIYVVIATIVSWQVDLAGKYGVDIVGDIPSGLQPPVVPDFSLFGQVIGDAFALSVVGYGIAISLGRIFALKYGYKVDSNQELIALGLSNSIGGFFQCFAISCSMSRSMVQESTGGRTQIAGALSAVVILFITLWIGTLFEDLPKAVLAAIIYVNLHGMMKQFLDIPALWKTNKVDMLVWVVTFILTVLLNPDVGLAASIGFSLLTVIFRTQLPRYSALGQIPDTDVYRPLEDYTQVRQVPGILIFRSSATLYFANAEMYQDALGEKSGIDITKILSARKKLEAKKKRHEKKVAKKAKKALKMNGVDHVNIVVESLESGGFFNEKVTKSCLFSTIHDAVLHLRSAQTQSQQVGPSHQSSSYITAFFPRTV
uniref:STAS domain-containing protein n=1 Tax=Salarias fasciatus TaxID=181472 RepID=A0A672GGY2_SALFA